MSSGYQGNISDPDLSVMGSRSPRQGPISSETRYFLEGSSAYGLHPLNSSVWANDSRLYGSVDTRCVWSNQSLICNLTDVTEPTHVMNKTSVSPFATWQLVFLGSLAGITSLVTVLGNLVVILSFILERTIRQPTNYFIASLAVSDLLIGAISMPFYTVYLLMGQTWPLGEFLCDLWLSLDYTICLTSIYTVLCITIDRFCSVKIPAKYRQWRTGRRVNIMIAVTWVVPIALFFTSVFGWQYFVGERTVPEGSCYVQYMDDAIFNCVLQVTYFWLTMTVMFGLYTGIYKAALQLHRKSRAKEKKMNSLVSMAGQTMTQIGIGMSKQAQEQARKERLTKQSKCSSGMGASEITQTTQYGAANTGSLRVKGSAKESEAFEDDRSSSPAFPSDNDASHSPKPTNPDPTNRNGRLLQKDKHANKTQTADRPVPKAASQETSRESRKESVSGPGMKKQRSLSIRGTEEARLQHLRLLADSGIYMGPVEPTETPPPSPPPPAGPAEPAEPAHTSPPPPAADNPPPAVPPCCSPPPATEPLITPSITTAVTISSDPELISGVKYIDQESIKSPEPKETFQLFGDMPRVQIRTNYQTYTIEDPGSPVWKKRPSYKNVEHGHSSVTNSAQAESPAVSEAARTETQAQSKLQGYTNPVCDLATANIHVESNDTNSSKIKTKLAKSMEGRSFSAVLNRKKRKKSRKISEMSYGGESTRSADEDDIDEDVGKTEAQIRKGPHGVHLKSIMKGVGSRKKSRKGSKKEKQRSKGENRARKALRTITIILGAFVICWTPWHVLSMIIGFCSSPDGCVIPVLYDISYWLCYLNSPINPFCYALANQQFKRAFLRILRLDWRKT